MAIQINNKTILSYSELGLANLKKILSSQDLLHIWSADKEQWVYFLAYFSSVSHTTS